MAAPVNIYLQWLLRGFIIKIYSGGTYDQDISKKFGQGKIYSYLKEKGVDILLIGADKKNKVDKYLGQGPKVNICFGKHLLNDFVSIFNKLSELKGFRSPYFNWTDFENKESVHIPAIIASGTGAEFKLEEGKPFGYYLNNEPEIARQIEEAVIKRLNKIYGELATLPAIENEPAVQGTGNSVAVDPVSKFICFRSSTNGRFIHIYRVEIDTSNNVHIWKLHSNKDKKDNYRSSRLFEEKGECIPLSSGRKLIQIANGAPDKKEISSLSIFEEDDQNIEYRGFRLGYNWNEKSRQLSVTRFYLISHEKLEQRFQQAAEKVKSEEKKKEKTLETFLNKLPCDIKVGSRAYNLIPFLPDRRFLPMRLGGVFDNTMTFYDGGSENEGILPDFPMLKVFFFAAKGALDDEGKKRIKKEDYKLAAEYLTKSLEHGLTGHIRNIEKHNEEHTKIKHKETDDFNLPNLKKLFDKIVEGIEKTRGSSGESWADEFLELRRRYDSTEDFSESSKIEQTDKKKIEKNWLYRRERIGGHEDQELTELLTDIFGYE